MSKNRLAAGKVLITIKIKDPLKTTDQLVREAAKFNEDNQQAVTANTREIKRKTVGYYYPADIKSS